MKKKRLKRWQKWTIVGVLTPVVAVVAFLIIYQLTHKAEQKAEKDFTELADDAATTGAAVTLDSLGGSWTTITIDPANAEQADKFYVGYRVDEVLFGQNVTATGRTRDVVGTLVFDGSTLTNADFTALMATVTSDESRRDGQFRGRIMAVDEFPEATFTLTQPIALDAVPSEGEVVTLSAMGDLTVRGTTKSVTFDLKAFHSAGTITVTGEIPIVFDEWGVPNPTGGPATTEDHGSMEFLLTFARAA